jgi:uncharacterized protein (DUF302 family)
MLIISLFFNINPKIMKYYNSKTISATFDEAITLVTETLKTEGFGVISEIRMHDKLKEKLDVNFKKYTILGACNPAYAYKALQLEDKIGAMLPCNILVIEQGKNKIEVAAINPLVSMQSVANNDLNDIARTVSAALSRVIEKI